MNDTANRTSPQAARHRFETLCIQHGFGTQRHATGLFKGHYLDARTEMLWQFVLEWTANE